MEMQKTPMAAINELCMRNNAVPNYEMVSEAPFKEYECNLTFTWQALRGIQAIGRGRTKRGAKHAAAFEALKLIYDVENADCDFDKGYLEIENIRSPCADELAENYVKILKDACSKNMLPAPEYELVKSDSGRFKTYSMQCNVSSLAEVAVANSKKQAKQRAAALMMKKLLGLKELNLVVVDNVKENKIEMETSDRTTDENNNEPYKTNETLIGDLIKKYCRKNTFKYSKLNINDYHNISNLEEGFFPMNYAVIQKLKSLPDTHVNDPKTLIADVCELSEMRFEYHQITRITKSAKMKGHVFVALQVFTPMPLVVIERGMNVHDAESKASWKMLKILNDLAVPIRSDKDYNCE